MSWKSTPLAVQLLLAFVGLVLAATLVLTYSAYRSTFDSLEADARRAVRAAAHTRAQMVTQSLTARHQRARGLLVSAESACSERTPSGRLAWALDCLSPMVHDFRAAERAVALHLTYRGRRIASSGPAITHATPVPEALAAVVFDSEGNAEYQTRSDHGEMTLTMRFDGDEIRMLLSDSAGLRSHGEVFLTDGNGRFLTAARYWTSSSTLTPPGAMAAEPLAPCLAGEGEIVASDYRGAKTIHGFEPLPALGSACVDAHMDYDEAMAPAEELREQLTARGGMFAVLGALLSLLAAHRIAAPVRRLANTARELQAGRFDTPIPLSGPTEVRRLGLAFRGMAADLAELVAREQAARREAEEANKTKDEFLATVSHELRTPLTAILGWTRLLRLGHLDSEQGTRAVKAIERSGEVLRRLVEDLLDVSRVMANRVRIVPEPTSLTSVVEKALDSVRPQAADKSVRIEMVFDEDELVVLGDAQRLQQVVWNLAWNAVKFTSPGGWVKIAGRREGSTIELAVSDNGTGIPRGFLPFVFDWFRQADSVSRGSQSGLGLGLGLVQHLVRLHGGTVRAESDGEGHGATFIVTLPAYAGVSNEAMESHRTVADSPLESVSVLVVDDDEETREVLRALLEEAGAEVRTASSAAEARVEIGTAEPDVLISDISMPQEDGYAFMRALRASNVKTPAIALTALARREDADTARAAGYHLHLKKPANPDDLIAAVNTLNVHRTHDSGHAAV
jgi:signal transduction histidine kinase/ActR/RegA family two-component response regulator